MPELKNTSGFHYLQSSRLDRNAMAGRRKHAIAEVPTFKTYPQAPQITLPRTWDLGEERLSTLLQGRRSLRKYNGKPLSLEHLAFLLWASQGITGQAGKYLFRTTPSAGALYPIETYINANSIHNLAPGLYHFNAAQFCLERISDDDKADNLAQACLNQKFMAQAAVIFLWTAVLRRTMSKYGNRGMRYILLDAGHICQNVLTAAEEIGCGGCPIGAFFDNELNDLLQIDGEEEMILYATAVGGKQG